MTTELSEKANQPELLGKQKADTPPSYETTQLITKKFECNTFGTMPFTFYGTWENPLFDIHEVGDLLGLVNIHKAIQDFKEHQIDRLTLSDSIGRMRERPFLKIKGLYRLIGKSRKPYAIEFQEWMYDIMEEIRLKGKYELEQRVNSVEQKALEDKAAAEARCV